MSSDAPCARNAVGRRHRRLVLCLVVAALTTLGLAAGVHAGAAAPQPQAGQFVPVPAATWSTRPLAPAGRDSCSPMRRTPSPSPAWPGSRRRACSAVMLHITHVEQLEARRATPTATCGRGRPVRRGRSTRRSPTRPPTRSPTTRRSCRWATRGQISFYNGPSGAGRRLGRRRGLRDLDRRHRGRRNLRAAHAKPHRRHDERNGRSLDAAHLDAPWTFDVLRRRRHPHVRRVGSRPERRRGRHTDCWVQVQPRGIRRPPTPAIRASTPIANYTAQGLRGRRAGRER